MKKSLLIGMVLLLIVGCSGTKTDNQVPQTDPKRATSGKKITAYQELKLRYNQLWKQNQELRKMYFRLEKENKENLEHLNQKIENLTTTIQLLELNLKQQQTLIASNQENLTSNQKPVDTKKPKTPIVEKEVKKEKASSGIESGFITPDSSKAVKTIPLLPSISVQKGNEKDQKPLIAVKPETNDEKMVDKKSTDILGGGYDDNAWEDKDLNQPSSPIRLQIVSGAKKNYNRAFKTYSNREFDRAINLFGQFLIKFPNDLDADNSQYWIGQSFYQLEKFEQAEKAFRKVLRNYEHKDTKLGYKTPDAILMLGRIYINKNKPIKSRYYFEKVIERFPDSRSADKARREIQSMSIF